MQSALLHITLLDSVPSEAGEGDGDREGEEMVIKSVRGRWGLHLHQASGHSCVPPLPASLSRVALERNTAPSIERA